MTQESVARDERWLHFARRYLRFGIRSKAQTRAYLTNRSAPEPAIDRILEICSREGLIDDRAGARLWAEALADRGYALSAIRAQLNERGFDDRAIDHALNTLRGRGDDEPRARIVAAGFFKTSSGSARSRRASLARRLARHGFDSELIDRLLCESFGPLLE